MAGRHYLEKQGVSAGQPEADLIDAAVLSLGLDQLGPFDPKKKIIEYAVLDEPRLASMSVREFVDVLSTASPTPGGGSVAALCGSLGAALAAMVGNLTVGKKGYDEQDAQMRQVAAEGQALKDELLAAVDRDSAAYDAVMVAIRLPKTDARAGRSAPGCDGGRHPPGHDGAARGDARHREGGRARRAGGRARLQAVALRCGGRRRVRAYRFDRRLPQRPASTWASSKTASSWSRSPPRRWRFGTLRWRAATRWSSRSLRRSSRAREARDSDVPSQVGLATTRGRARHGSGRDDFGQRFVLRGTVSLFGHARTCRPASRTMDVGERAAKAGEAHVTHPTSRAPEDLQDRQA